MNENRAARICLLLLSLPLCMTVQLLNAQSPDQKQEARPPANEAEMRFWLENMVWWHRYSDEEVAQTIGLTLAEVREQLRNHDVKSDNRPRRDAKAPLLVLPYPGGRHPRIGFLDGAVRPQRETKVSVFTPWDEASYVVVDVPEAIWSNLGLTYLAHTHVPTIWTKQGVELPRLEWQRRGDGSFELDRKLPNGIAYRAKVKPGPDAVRFELSLTNGTSAPLSDLRVQTCVMLKGTKGFEQQTNANKVFRSPYAACRSADGKRWIITAWDRCHRAWGNDKCPCLHSDPKFADCQPGETQRVQGLLWFFEGADLDSELRRLEATGWRK